MLGSVSCLRKYSGYGYTNGPDVIRSAGSPQGALVVSDTFLVSALCSGSWNLRCKFVAVG